MLVLYNVERTIHVQPDSVVLERGGIGCGVLGATMTVSALLLLEGTGCWVLLEEDGSAETTASSLECRPTGQKISEADLDGARRGGARVSTTESLEDNNESERVGIGGNGASSGSFVIFLLHIDVSECDRVGRTEASDVIASDASLCSLFRKVHQEPAFCTLMVSVLVLSIPPVNLRQSNYQG